MAMPHPGFFMLPFGCVVCSRLTNSGASIDISLDVDDIKGLHKAFTVQWKHTPYATLAETIINTKDETGATVPNYGDKSVIAYDSLVLQHPDQKPYQAWRLHSRAPHDTVPERILPADIPDPPKIIMESNWYYFLLLDGITPTLERGRSRRTDVRPRR